jgi:hypothetical protein
VQELVVGRGQRVGDRCIIPILQISKLRGNRGAIVQATPIALVIAEGADEYTALLPGAGEPETMRALLATLREAIEREKQTCE